MPDPVNPKLSNSYDMFCRGEEIISGAQRVHDSELLAQRIKECGIDVKGGLEDYVNAFKYGAMPQYALFLKSSTDFVALVEGLVLNVWLCCIWASAILDARPCSLVTPADSRLDSFIRF